MKVVVYKILLFVYELGVLFDVELFDLVVIGCDLLVEICVILVNLVDIKVWVSIGLVFGQDWKVLGWDVSGIVCVVGLEVMLFKLGDWVWYVGLIVCFGINSELYLVDECIVGYVLVMFDFVQVVVLLLMIIIVWEMLFDWLGIVFGKQFNFKSLFIIGVFGGVGLIMIQFVW